MLEIPRTSIGTVLGLALGIAIGGPVVVEAQVGAGTLQLTDTVFEGRTRALAEVGYLTAPLDLEAPEVGSTKLRFLRLPGFQGNSSKAVFYLGGGPGHSGVQEAVGAFPLLTMLRSLGDVVVVDYRGTGGSLPNLSCPEGWAYPLDRAGSWHASMVAMREAIETCVAHLEGEGVDLTQYSTPRITDDVDAVRRALGYDEVDLFGISFGSHVGLEFLRRYPDVVRRAVFLGLHGLDRSVTLPSEADSVLSLLDNAFVEASTDSWELRSLRHEVERLLSRLDEEPAQVSVLSPDGDSVTVTFGRFDVSLEIAQGIRHHRNNATMWLVRTLYDALHGDLSRAAWAVAAGRSRGLDGMGLAVACASGISEERRRRMEAEAPTSLLGLAASFPGMEFCESVPHEKLGPAFWEPVRSDVPVLFVTGTFDGGKVIEHRDAQRLTNATQLMLGNGFHNDYIDLWPLYVDHVLRFLRGQPVETSTVELPLSFSVPEES